MLLQWQQQSKAQPTAIKSKGLQPRKKAGPRSTMDSPSSTSLYTWPLLSLPDRKSSARRSAIFRIPLLSFSFLLIVDVMRGVLKPLNLLINQNKYIKY